MRKRANTPMRTGPDLISSLPDQILHHILGFLKMREAVQTCVLSKRWEHLWASVRSLHFDPNDFINWEKSRKLESCSERFVNFVNAVLLRREPFDLDVFQLSCEEPHGWEHEEQTRNWIHYAVKHRTRVMHLSDFYSLPSCLYTCTSIEELHLFRCEVHISGTVNLPKLRKLVMFYDNSVAPFPKNLLSGCNILEFLELNYYLCGGEIVIAHEYLKHFHVIDCIIHRLFIDAPNLLSFSCISSYSWYEFPVPPPHETILNTPTLMFARFDTSCSQMSKHLKAVTSMLGALSNAEHLKLYISCEQLKKLQCVQLQELPIFHKLKDATIALCARERFEKVAWILNRSPNLKKLTLVELPCCFRKRRAITSDSTDVSLMVAITSCKKLEIIEVKYQMRRDQKMWQLGNALIDSTKESDNPKIKFSKCKSSWPYFE